jgi:hypothetical protein
MTVFLIYNEKDTMQIYRFENPDPTLLNLLRSYIGYCEDYPSGVSKFLENLPEDNLVLDDTAEYQSIKGDGPFEIIVCGVAL